MDINPYLEQLKEKNVQEVLQLIKEHDQIHDDHGSMILGEREKKPLPRRGHEK